VILALGTKEVLYRTRDLGAVTAAIQAAVVVLSGSVALLGDTLHNVADALTAAPLLIAFRLARRPATKRYTYGYGRAEDLGGLFVIAMIALSSVLAAWEAIDRLIHPRDALQFTRLSDVSDPAAFRYCDEIGPGSYDKHQALEGAAGFAGRTESTSVIEPKADLMTISSGPAADHGVTRETSCLTCQPGPTLTSSATRPKTCCAPLSAATLARSRGSARPLTGSSCPRRNWLWPASTGSLAGPSSGSK
jgi:hypothetical protein